MDVTTCGVRANGTRALAVQLEEGVRALVEPLTEDLNERAELAARRIADQAQATTAAEVQISALEVANADLAEQLRRARARIGELEAINEAATTGRRRFFGPVLMQPAVPGEWGGAVWLLDPEKGTRGRGLHFSSVAEVRALHPELWVVSASVDGIILDVTPSAGRA